MNVAFRKAWTQEQFFAWEGHGEGRYEFDGLQPVAMVGGTVNHSIIARNVHRALDGRLRGGKCQSLGPDVGVVTIGTAVRYPDALVTCSRLSGTSLTVPGAVVVFEVLSPSSGRTDRIVKVREYAAVASIRRYVILESAGSGASVFHRARGGDDWTATALTTDDILVMPEIGIEIPVAEFYDGVEFADPPADPPA